MISSGKHIISYLRSGRTTLLLGERKQAGGSLTVRTTVLPYLFEMTLPQLSSCLHIVGLIPTTAAAYELDLMNLKIVLLQKDGPVDMQRRSSDILRKKR